MSGVVGIWLHQFSEIAERDLDGMGAAWPGWTYVKATDGGSFMGDHDRDIRAVYRSDGGVGWIWNDGRRFTPWVVPTAPSDLAIVADVAIQAGAVIVDMEPYAGFWRGTAEEAESFLWELRRVPGLRLGLSIDHRRLPAFPTPEALVLADVVMPQVYWTTFGRPWRVVVEEALRVVEPHNAAIEFVYPGDSETGDLVDALAWSVLVGRDVSIWAWDTLTAWDVVRQFSRSVLAGTPGVSRLREALGLIDRPW